ncbi:MAG: hypothetical protein E7446_01980 [Ruminococcaceae bacterium]|nr:hypothetical protein [Oscillospiraceae bacterium]
MEKRGTRYVIAFCVSVITGVLLQCLYEEMGGPVLSTLVPVNGSAWEQGKLCFWPYLAGALLIWRLGDGQDSRGGHCVLLLVMPLMMTLVCQMLHLTERWEIAAAWCAVLMAGMMLYAFVLRHHLWGGELLWYTLAILLGIAYLLLTVLPPQGALFTEPLHVPTLAIPV